MKKSGKGFTLIEMLVVLVIAGLALGLLAPKVGSGWKRMRDRDFLSDFTAEMRKARIAALRGGGAETFRINGADKVYGYGGPPLTSIPDNVDIFAEGLEQDQETGDFVVRFHSDGSAEGTDMDVIFDGERKYSIMLDPLFGSVRVVRGGGSV